MKRPALFLSMLFVAIVGSTALVSTTISGICRAFYKNETQKNVHVKSEKQVIEELKTASVKL